MTTVYADEYGFSNNDATSAIQDAINDPNADTIVVRDMGSPWLISERIMLQSNKEIIFEEGVVVQAKPGSFSANDESMFFGRDIENIKLIGQGAGENLATLKMNKEEYNDTSSKFGHVISLAGVTDYEVSGLRLTGGGGDGLFIAGGSFGLPPDPNYLYYSENGLVENIVADNNRRSGISIDSAKNLVVRNSTINNNNSGPKFLAGINIEPTWNFEKLENISIENVDLNGNLGRGIKMVLGNMDSSSGPVSVNFNDISLNDSNDNPIFITGKYLAKGEDFGSEYKGVVNQNLPGAEIDGAINFNNINISNSDKITNSGGSDNPNTYIFVEGISGNQDDPNNLKINFNDVNINDPVDIPVSTVPIFIQGLPGENNPQEVGNTSFDDVTIAGNYDTHVVRADMLRSDGNLNNVAADVTVYNANERGASTYLPNENQTVNADFSVIEGNGEAPAVNDTNVENSDVVAEEVAPEPEDSEVVVEEEVIEPEDSDVVAEEVAPEPEDSDVVAEEEVAPEPEDSDVVVEEEVAPEPEDSDVVAEEEVIEPEDSEVVVEEEVAPELEDSEVVAEEEVAPEPENSEDNLGSTGIETPVKPIIESAPSTIKVNNSSFTDELTGWNSVGENISVVERSQGDRWAQIGAPIGGISQNITEQIDAGEDYQIGATTQLSESGTDCYIGVLFTTDAKEIVDFEYTSVTGSALQDSQVDFTAPEEFDRADVFAIKNNGSADFFVDDFSLSEQV